MSCHNGAELNDYSGPGLENPHASVGNISCTFCHGGNGEAETRDLAHVPRPPDIADDLQLSDDAEAYFNFLTHTGIDKFPDYQANDETFSALDYLQFINPGDLRVVGQGRGCGQGACHGNNHGTWVPRGVIATEAGFYSATLFTSGLPNANPEMQGWYGDTASEYGFRAISNPDFAYDPTDIGAVGELYEFPELAQYPGGVIYQNDDYTSPELDEDIFDANDGTQYANTIKPGTELADLLRESIAITCGDCHLGSRGANNRYADFRSSGCTACHMQYSPDGRSRSNDPNVRRDEPANPDAIVAPEDSHPAKHVLTNVARILPSGGIQRGINDYACVGCHQGSNRTVLQFWGVRLDQNQDVVNQLQYPANPESYQNTANNQDLFDPGVRNLTFNGRNANQYLDFEDYDDDGLDDIPADIHREAGMGCIDCHGSRDLHNGASGNAAVDGFDPTSGQIRSRESQAVLIECESCHGSVDERARTGPCVDYEGRATTCGMDRNGNPLRNTLVDADGQYFLKSRVTGNWHFIPQTYDTVRPNNVRHPFTDQLVYTPAASYAMGRADGDNVDTGIGPLQGNPNLVRPGFTHLATGRDSDGNLECSACHASWANNCIGCHLAPGYDATPQNYFFSNTTGERIVLFQAAADFVYITPIPFQLGVGTRNVIASTAPGMKMFFRYQDDLNGETSNVFAFTDRRGNGNNPGYQGRGNFGALAHNKIAPHSQRGAADSGNEGVRSCPACHLNTDQIANFGTEYDEFRTAMQNDDFGALDFATLQIHIGQNTGNEFNSPFFVHMVAGLGSGLFLFDANGCPVNPLDNNANRFNCNNVAPATVFDPNNVVYNLDRMVQEDGVDNASNAHPLEIGTTSTKRSGSPTADLAGPLGGPLLERLTNPNTGLILDSWLDTNGDPQGNAPEFLDNN